VNVPGPSPNFLVCAFRCPHVRVGHQSGDLRRQPTDRKVHRQIVRRRITVASAGAPSSWWPKRRPK
jgi:hypothetical protein